MLDPDETFDEEQGVDVLAGTWDADDEGVEASGPGDGTLE